MLKQKLLIGIPGYAGIVPEAMDHFLGMIYRCGRDCPDLDVAVNVIVKREQFRARNALVDAAIGAGFDWLLMLDDDMCPPPDLVPRLLAHDKDVCGALYYQRGGAYHPVVLHRILHEHGGFSTRFYDNFDPIFTNPGLYKVDILGGGAMLFKVDVFRKLMPPYFAWEETLGTDIAICSRLLDAGVEIFIDTSLELGHVRDEKEIITSRTVSFARREIGAINETLWHDAQGYLCMSSEELESKMVQASPRDVRNAKWHSRDRSTWEGVRAYYQDFGDWHVLNLLNFNMRTAERSKEWALLHADSLLSPGQDVLDVGPGLGHVALPLVQRYGARVHAVEIAKAPTLDFLRYRMRQHDCGIRPDRHKGIVLYETETPVPLVGPVGPVAGAFAISMIEHTWDPEGLLRWITDLVQPGGFLVCDYAVDKMDDEPQHLVRYDVSRFAQMLQGLGWVVSPEFEWLFIRRG